ncbi:MAG: VanZ family protein [Clostridiales bacterium]|nr:VanZ family protein [Clostridiales bacterium]
MKDIKHDIVIVILTLVYLLILMKAIVLKHAAFGIFYEELVHSSIWHLLPRPYGQFNFVPFDTIKLYMNNYHLLSRNIVIGNLIGNVGLFVPIGMLLKSFKSIKISNLNVILLGLLLSITLEILQYISGLGIADVDDLILNVSGVVLGIVIVNIFTKNHLKNQDK